MNSVCKHNEAHNARVEINYMEDTGDFQACVFIECAKCGKPFQFLGLPLGLSLVGAAMSVDGVEARLAIAPVGAVPHPLAQVKAFQYHIPLPKVN